MPSSTQVFREDYVAVVGSWLLVGSLEILTLTSLTTQADPGLERAQRAVGALLSLVCTAAFVALQVSLIRRERLNLVPALVWTQVVSAMLLLPISHSWTTLGVAIAAITLSLDLKRGFLGAVSFATVAHAYLFFSTDQVVDRVGIPIVNWVSAVVLYAMTRLVIVLNELRRTREHLARLHVDEERLRISRDLHDIIGRTLVAVSLRTETAMRLLDVDVERCRHQLQQAQSSIIDGQGQLRALTSGPVIIGLRSELETARALFDRLGIRCVVDVIDDADGDDPEIEKTLAAVVRESVTNMLKHSRPRECRIGVRRESIATIVTVVNDGARGTSLGDSSGTGLVDLTIRVEALGGVLTAGLVESGQFRVIARIPHAEQLSSSPAPSPTPPGTRRDTP